MIAHENDCSRAMQTTFLEMLPAIRNQANVAFRDLPPQRQEDLIAEVTANAFVAYTRLVERGLADIAYPTPLALFAIKQVRSGRRVGVTLNVRDVGSRYPFSGPADSPRVPPGSVRLFTWSWAYPRLSIRS